MLTNRSLRSSVLGTCNRLDTCATCFISGLHLGGERCSLLICDNQLTFVCISVSRRGDPTSSCTELRSFLAVHEISGSMILSDVSRYLSIIHCACQGKLIWASSKLSSIMYHSSSSTYQLTPIMQDHLLPNIHHLSPGIDNLSSITYHPASVISHCLHPHQHQHPHHPSAFSPHLSALIPHPSCLRLQPLGPRPQAPGLRPRASGLRRQAS